MHGKGKNFKVFKLFPVIENEISKYGISKTVFGGVCGLFGVCGGIRNVRKGGGKVLLLN